MRPDGDPVLARRARLARAAEVGQRVGYGLIGVAGLGFAVGLVVGFENRAVAVTVIVALSATVVTLLPGIILGYAVKAAEREDREDLEGQR